MRGNGRRGGVGLRRGAQLDARVAHRLDARIGVRQQRQTDKGAAVLNHPHDIGVAEFSDQRPVHLDDAVAVADARFVGGTVCKNCD